MKKQLLIISAFTLLFCSNAIAQTYVIMVKPFDSKTWAYANLKGELIIKPEEGKCYKFSSDGLAPIYGQKAKQYYFINIKGEKLQTEITDFKIKDGFGFDVTGFSDGMALVKHNDKWGYLNTNGKLAIAAKYDDGSDFDGGFAVVKSGDKFIVINKKGEEKMVESGVMDVKDFSEGLAPYKASDKKFGFIGSDGKVAVKAQYESVGYFSDGLAWAKASDGKLGYINPKGEWAIQPQFLAGKEFDSSSGLARIKTTEKWAYVNKTGQTTNMDDTEVWGDFSDGLADGKKNDKRGFYDKTGKWVIQPQFDGIRDFKNGYAAAKQGDKWGLIDKQGKWIIQAQFDGIKDVEMVK